jgi:hypothetical protein
MHDIDVQIIQVGEWYLCLFHTNLWKTILHDYYCQIVAHEVYDDIWMINGKLFIWKKITYF